MVSQADSSRILNAINASSLTGSVLRKFAMEQLDTLETYNWSGIYRLEGETLVLDEYVGAATDHTRIAVGVGVCGTAVAQKQNQVIADVRKLNNYLACSLETRAELVVLIFSPDHEILGQIDIDGHTIGAFDASDEAMLEAMAKTIAARWL